MDNAAARETVVFLYGAEMHGEAYHSLVASAEFMGTTRTAPRYDLLDFIWSAALAEEGRTAVMGELYRVDTGVLADLDLFEGFPEFCDRSAIELFDGQMAQAYLPRGIWQRKAFTVTCGDWRARSSRTCGVVSGNEESPCLRWRKKAMRRIELNLERVRGHGHQGK